VLIMALILGKVRRTGGMNWTIPFSANLVIRNLGLTLFLAQVGMASGPKFAATVTETGLVMLGLGAIVLVALVLPILILGLLFFRMPFDEVAGIVAGACGNPAILAYSNKLTPTDRPGVFLKPPFSRSPIRPLAFGIGPRSDRRPRAPPRDRRRSTQL
jgi:putative transport protein